MRSLLIFLFTPMLAAQQPIGRTSATEVKVSGPVEISHGETVLGNGSEITAGDQAVKITLERGGVLHLCSTSSIHLSKDRSVDDPSDSALMMALDRGAMEAYYAVGKYSDVLLTPDLRILISGPGTAELSIRVNTKGDTCVDNHGVAAPYVTVSSQLEGGAYRVMPGQRVTFEHGSLQEVVDHEPEACGCPVLPPVSTASATGGPSSTPADTAFPHRTKRGACSSARAAPRAGGRSWGDPCPGYRSPSPTTGRILLLRPLPRSQLPRQRLPAKPSPTPLRRPLPRQRPPLAASSVALATFFRESLASGEGSTIDNWGFGLIQCKTRSFLLWRSLPHRCVRA